MYVINHQHMRAALLGRVNTSYQYQHIGVVNLHIHATYSRDRCAPVIPRNNMLRFAHLHVAHQIRWWEAMGNDFPEEMHLRKPLPTPEFKSLSLHSLLSLVPVQQGWHNVLPVSNPWRWGESPVVGSGLLSYGEAFVLDPSHSEQAPSSCKEGASLTG